MLDLSRRNFVMSAALAAAFGLDARLVVSPAFAQQTPDPQKGFHKYTVGAIEVTALYDGIWEKPHDPAFIKNASVEDTKAALAKAGQPTAFVSIPLTVVVLTIGGRHILVDFGVGRPMAADRRQAARQYDGGRHRSRADRHRADLAFPSRSHFRADGEGHQQAGLPDAELVASATEYKWWTEPGRVEKLPEARKPLGQRIQAVFPTWKNFR